MDRSAAADYSDPSSAQQYTSRPEVRQQSHYSTTATPTSEYSYNPASARSSSFPEHHLQRVYHSGTSMAQATNPSIAAPSPTQYTYPQSPYGSQDMAHGYGGPNVFAAQPRPPDWTGYAQPGHHGQHGQSPITPGHHVFSQTQGQHNKNPQVFSFVPIPGAQQHKRPRRRYEEIERMYKCGWNGCEKAYGTLNHLNAHVTMQSHGQKRVPEEFKEIRKEWKARKKAEEADRKKREENLRASETASHPQSDGQTGPDANMPQVSNYNPRALPPIGYTQTNYPPPAATDYSSSYIAGGGGFPGSPYSHSHQQVYGQSNGGQTSH